MLYALLYLTVLINKTLAQFLSSHTHPLITWSLAM